MRKSGESRRVRRTRYSGSRDLAQVVMLGVNEALRESSIRRHLHIFDQTALLLCLPMLAVQDLHQGLLLAHFYNG